MNKESKVWKNYQKEIPEDHYFYVRSCIRQTFFPGAEASLLRLLRNDLNRDVFEDARHTCCTGIGYHADIIPLETIMTVMARQFSLMNEGGYSNMLVSCVTSFGLYCEVLDMWEHSPELEAKIREQLFQSTGREFDKPKHVVHGSDLVYRLRDEIKRKNVYQLINKETNQPLRVVEHVGCHYAKIFPHKSVGGAEFPEVLSGMIEAWGGEVIDYPERRHCCGFGFRHYLLQENRGYSIAQTRTKLRSMEPYQPDFILTNCPGCTMFLDRWQYTLAEMEGVTYDQKGRGIPVLSYEELAALLMGFDPWEIGLHMHQVQVEQLLDKIGIRYDPDMKYRAKNGDYMGKPAAPDVLIV
ncbi:heterodisulfide reductase subunit B [Marinilabiliaceae bacterium JC017]|nr:heterodisulfide reductase subunit B [Marinilabiliaceae bacterium JC017]